MPETRASEIEALRNELEQLRAMMMGRNSNIYSIPDPIKNLSEFSGNRNELASWLREVSELYEMFKIKGENGQPDSLSSVYIRAIKNKIKGNARAILCANGDPDTLREIKHILTEQYGDQRDFPTNISEMFRIKKGEKTHLKLFNEIKELNTRLKANLSNNPLTGKEIIDVLSLTTYLDNIGEPLGTIIRLSAPKTLEDAFRAVCINQNAEVRAKSAKPSHGADMKLQKQHNYQTTNNNNYGKPRYKASASGANPSNAHSYKKPTQQFKHRAEHNTNEIHDDDERDNDDDDDDDTADSAESKQQNFQQGEEDWMEV